MAGAKALCVSNWQDRLAAPAKKSLSLLLRCAWSVWHGPQRRSASTVMALPTLDTLQLSSLHPSVVAV